MDVVLATIFCLRASNSSKTQVAIELNLLRYGSRKGGPLSNAVNLILRLFFVPFFTYHELVTSQVHPQQHKQTKNITTMVMEPFAPPAVWNQ
jgi:hypothetical protein